MQNNKVYVVTNPEDEWDCVKGVFGSEETLVDYFNSIKITDEEDGIKDFTGMSAMEIDEFLGDNDCNYIIHSVTVV